MKKNLEHYIKNLSEPLDYLNGISSDIRYNPEKLVFFSRLKTNTLVNNSPTLHHRFNLLFCFKGSLKIHIGNILLTLKEGESLLVFPYQSHYYVCDKEQELLWFFIGFEMQERRGLERLRNTPVTIEPFIHSCLERMISSHVSLTIPLVSVIIAANLEEAGDPKIGNPDLIPSSIREEGSNSAVSLVQQYIFSDLSRTFTMAEMSRDLGFSESSLHRSFKRVIGISPGRYIREVKVNHACSLLETGDYSVTEAALNCGYDSVYSFSRAFKRVMGFSPSHLQDHR